MGFAQKKEESLSPTRQAVVEEFKAIQNRICEKLAELNGSNFISQPWQKEEGEMLQGGGEMRSIKGRVFEKGGVNFSEVYGTFSEEFRKEIPGAEESDGEFWASGVSLVIHPYSPLVPTVHMNIRRIETSKAWFGGGSDLTPTIVFEEDKTLFHNGLKQACDAYDPEAYVTYKDWCDKYFFIKHWNEPRGVGGIFFDSLNSGDESKDFDFVLSTADAFLESYVKIVEQRKDMPWTFEQKQAQYAKRAKYVEFNLLYDRGTRFGFMSGGNPEAILMSMPPIAHWS